jgi:transposase
VRLIPAASVKPFVRRTKTGARDAAAICAALKHPDMRCVALKSAAQQAARGLERSRELLVKTAHPARRPRAQPAGRARPGGGPGSAWLCPARRPAGGRRFRSARAFAAWAGRTPREHATAGQPRSQGISRQGDRRLRPLFALGAWAVLVSGAVYQPQRQARTITAA